MSPFAIRWFITTAAVFFTTLVPGIGVHSDRWTAIVWAGLLLGIINTVVRPVLLLVSLPVIVLTLGLFIVVLNAITLEIVGGLVSGFHVDGFFSAVLGSAVISFVSGTLGRLLNVQKSPLNAGAPQTQVPAPIKTVRGRVIDNE